MAQPFKFIHCGDLHLGAPFVAMSSLGKFGDDMLVEATYKAFENICNMAIEERVDAVLISGDIYNSTDHNLEAQVRFVRELEKLSNHDIQVFIVHGNHDPVDAWSSKIKMPPKVHVFAGDKAERIPLVARGKEVAAVYGISHSHKGIFEDLSDRIMPTDTDEYSIGLLHATIGGLEEKTEYAPTSVEKLRSKNINYWALGHIHKREILNRNPHIVYAGNPQGLNRKEEGAKGCYLVKVGVYGDADLEFRETSAIVFASCEIDISGFTELSQIEELIRHKKKMMASKYRRPILLRIVLTGQGELAAACQDESAREFWLKNSQAEETGKKFDFVLVHRIDDETLLPIDLQARRELPDILGDYLRAYDKIADLNEAEKRQALAEIILDRNEMKRLGGYKDLIDAELIENAFKRAEIEGARRLWSIGNEDK